MPRTDRFRIHISSLILVMGLLVPATVLAGSIPSELSKCLGKLPQSSTVCGAAVIDLNTGELVFGLNETQSLIPASNQKLIVIAAALDTIGSQGVYRTTLAARGQDLIVIGDGDPALGDPNLAEQAGVEPMKFITSWANALAEEGERTNPSMGGDAAHSWIIPGDFIVDDTILDTEYFHPDWVSADRVKWYGAPIGGLNLNNNCVEMTAIPSGKAGDSCAWSIFPSSSALNVINGCVTSSSSKSVPVIGRRPGTADLVLSGKVGRQVTLQSVSVYQPSLFAATAIREALAGEDIHLQGETRFERVRTRNGSLPNDLRIIAEHVTPLPDVLQRIGHDSQNMCAEALFKRLGREWTKRQHGVPSAGSWANGREAVLPTLQRAGCDVQNMVVADGSGLSRSNRLTALDLARLLQYMHKHPESKTFKESLAGNRTGGKLKRRMSDVDADVFAKTGYLTGVRSLSGYVRTKENCWYAFSVIFNGFRGSSGPYNKLHEKVCDILADGCDNAPRKP
ncbi:MAG TPA: D-alanyl-D-alanine carboxypeptidase/D-alanyl-D-alanine-endopeptidase [Phycisphaerae bacterium]|nr:D-alanyl-D-alanine carboxypeptidase/D-alanyl-D-alanine-endopeptidase [Phycisphaerae bacterium]